MTVRAWILLLSIICIVFSLSCFASASSPVCSRQSKPLLLTDIPAHCPLSSSSTSSLEVNEESLARALTSKIGDVYTSVLFYASWCPFSEEARKIFEVLSSMYPQIEHLAIEQSSVTPSVFSRYGIHSVPAILLINKKSKLRFHGPKDLNTLVKFYKKKTGYKPLRISTTNNFGSLGNRGAFIMQSWIGLSANEIFTREPYLVFSLLFLCLRLVIWIYPRVLHYLRALRVSFAPHLNLNILGERSQILGQALHIWTKLMHSKNRNLHHGARNARVWASSLASVALGETSPARSSSSYMTF